MAQINIDFSEVWLLNWVIIPNVSICDIKKILSLKQAVGFLSNKYLSYENLQI